MQSFSEKYGFEPVRKVIQSQSMNAPLRNGLWSALYDYYFWRFTSTAYFREQGYELHHLVVQIWKEFFKFPVDSIPFTSVECSRVIRTHFFEFIWYKVYNFIQFCTNAYEGDQKHNSDFRKECNRVLERENSAYRFVSNEIAPITSDAEITEIEKATSANDPIATHLKTALNLLADKESPNYRNSMKESISAVEAICGIIADKPKATLGDALGIIKKSGVIELHPTLNAAFDKLYGYTSDAGGIRHALIDESEPLKEDAIWMLVACSSFVNYLKVKQSRITTK
jgi:hypothetical protein